MRDRIKAVVDNLFNSLDSITQKLKGIYWSRVIIVTVIICIAVWLSTSAMSCKSSCSTVDTTTHITSDYENESLVDPLNANTIGNSSFNLQNSWESKVSFAYQDNWLYYSFKEHGIRRIIDGGSDSDIELLTYDTGYYLNVVGEWLYYITENTNSYSTATEYLIKRIKIDGSTEEILTDKIYTDRTPMYVGNGYIFFSNVNDENKTHVYRMDTNGQNKICIAPGYLDTVNFESQVLLAHEYDEDHSPIFASYSFDGNTSSAYSTVLNTFNYDDDYLYINVYDILGTNDYIIAAGDFQFAIVGLVSGYTNDAHQMALYQYECENICFADQTLYYAGTPYDMCNSGSDSSTSTGIHSVSNFASDSLLKNYDVLTCMFIPGDGWIYYRRELKHSSSFYTDYEYVWFRCTLDGQHEEYVSWMYE